MLHDHSTPNKPKQVLQYMKQQRREQLTNSTEQTLCQQNSSLPQGKQSRRGRPAIYFTKKRKCTVLPKHFSTDAEMSVSSLTPHPVPQRNTCADVAAAMTNIPSRWGKEAMQQMEKCQREQHFIFSRKLRLQQDVILSIRRQLQLEQ